MSTASPWRTSPRSGTALRSVSPPPWAPAAPAAALRRPTAARRLKRMLRRARRPLVALLLAAATALVVHAVLREPADAAGVPVVVAVRDLPAGADAAVGTEVVTLPAGSVPQGALGPDDVADDARLAAPVREGEVLTDVRVNGTGVLASLAPGQVALPVAVTSPLPTGLVSPGDRVAVLGAAEGGGFDDGAAPARGRVLVSTAAVLVVSSDATTTGLLSAGTGSTVVVLALDEDDAARVAAAAAGSGVALAVTR